MRSREKKDLLLAEEQLVWGRYLSEVMAARDELRLTHPDSLLLQLVDEKIMRVLGPGSARPAGGPLRRRPLSRPWLNGSLPEVSRMFATLTPSCTTRARPLRRAFPARP